MSTSKLSYDTGRTAFRFSALAMFALLAGCAGADGSPMSGPMPEMAPALSADVPRPRLESAPIAPVADQWKSPFAAQVFGEVDERASQTTAVRVRPSSERVREIAWGPLADREQKGNMARAQVTVSVPTATAVATAAAVRTVAQGRTGSSDLE